MSSNTFGTLFRFTTFGESHGPAIGCVVDGVPPMIPLTEADIRCGSTSGNRGNRNTLPSAASPMR